MQAVIKAIGALCADAAGTRFRSLPRDVNATGFLIHRITVYSCRLRIDEDIENQDRIVDVDDAVLVGVGSGPATELEPHRDMVPDDLAIILIDHPIAVGIAEDHRPGTRAGRKIGAAQLVPPGIFATAGPGSGRLGAAGKKKIQRIDRIGQLNQPVVVSIRRILAGRGATSPVSYTHLTLPTKA